MLSSAPAGSAWLGGSARVAGGPAFLTIETVNVCNIACVYCPQADGEEHFIAGRGVMALRDFVRILDTLEAAFPLPPVSLHRDGEPLLNRHLEGFVAELTRRGVDSAMSSNCTLTTPERARGLAEAGLGSVKTDFCADARRFEALRAGARWADALAGMRALLDAMGPGFRLLVTDLGTHAASPEQAAKALDATNRLLGDPRVTVVPSRMHGALGSSRLEGGTPAGRYVRCHQPWVNLAVDHAGRAVACCRDLRSEYVLGNLLEQPAEEVWNGPAARRLRRALAAERPGEVCVCARCDAPWTGSYSGRSAAEKMARFAFDPFWRGGS